MKKIFLTTASALLLTVSVFAADGGKKTNASTANVTYAVQQEFNADFANAQDVTWTVTRNAQKADFIEDGAKKTAFYTLTGEFLGTTQYIDVKAIPAAAKAQIAKNYKGYEATDFIVFQTNLSLNESIDPTAYFVNLKSAEHEVLVRVTQGGDVEFFKQVK